jgi:hypothetical protein
VLAERPQPHAVAVELELPPVFGGVPAVDGVAAREELLGGDLLAERTPRDERLDLRRARQDDGVAPGEERFGARRTPGPAHGIGDERAVPQPAEAVDREARTGEIGPRRALVRLDHLDAAAQQRAETSDLGRVEETVRACQIR